MKTGAPLYLDAKCTGNFTASIFNCPAILFSIHFFPKRFRMKKFYFLLLLCSMSSSFAIAQLYISGIGFRGGKFNTGASFKFFFVANNNTGLQVDATYSHIASGGYAGRGLMVKQIPFRLPIVQIPLDFIFGGGAHVSYFPFKPQGYYHKKNGEAVYYTKNTISAGIDATIQIEYQVKKIAPFTLGIDCNPYYEFFHPGPEWIDFGVTVRYVIRGT